MTSIKTVRHVSEIEARAASASTHSIEAKSVPHSQTEGMLKTPIDNMGVTIQDVQLVMSDGELKTVCVRSPSKGQIAIVDQVTFTFSLSTLESVGFDVIASEDHQVSQISSILEPIFGYGITGERKNGTDFYKRSFDLGQFGQVGIGGQNETVLVHLFGLGALKALVGWESRLHHFLSKVAIRPKITRIDLAYDDFNGEQISVDWALQCWRTGGFTFSGRSPQVEQIGNWLEPNGKGRTFCVGSRSSGKFCRIYEKGRKEGCSSSNWTRFEVELKGKDRVIPFDCLLDPSGYLAGCYPCAADFYLQANRIKTEKKTAEYNYEKMIEICKTQMGKQLRFLSNYLNDSDEVLSLVMHPDPKAIPKRLAGITSGINTMPEFLHNVPVRKIKPEHINFSIKVN